jgi:hypothetical protein
MPSRKQADQKFVYEGTLKEGTFKLMSTNEGGFGTDDKDWFYAPANETVINESGCGCRRCRLWHGNAADNQWKVTKAGKYKITVDMKAHTIKAEYLDK